MDLHRYEITIKHKDGGKQSRIFTTASEHPPWSYFRAMELKIEELQEI